MPVSIVGFGSPDGGRLVGRLVRVTVRAVSFETRRGRESNHTDVLQRRTDGRTHISVNSVLANLVRRGAVHVVFGTGVGVHGVVEPAEILGRG